MDHELLGLAFAAGLVAALNPCGFALLPAYLTFVVGGAGTNRSVAVGRAVLATAAMTVGFLAVFAVFGALTVSLAATVQRYLPILTVLLGLLLVAAGLWLLAGRELRLPVAAPGGLAPTAKLGSMFGYGVGYAIASLSCTVGPFLAVTAAAARSGSPAATVATYLVYAAGFALVVGTLAVAAAFASASVADRLRRALPVVTRIGGAVLVLVGGYVSYYGSYELRLFHGDGAPGDAVVAAAGRVQGALAGWVHAHGGWPWLIVLVALLVAAAVAAGRRRRRSQPGAPTQVGGPDDR